MAAVDILCCPRCSSIHFLQVVEVSVTTTPLGHLKLEKVEEATHLTWFKCAECGEKVEMLVP